jgi:hypothetical protein
MSTVSTFLPHNGRGPSASNRRLVQSLLELLIWSRTQAAPEVAAFAASLAQLTELAAASAEGGSKAEAEAAVHKMQTVIRRLRKELSASAREKGFALCTQYALDPSSISLSMVRR